MSLPSSSPIDRRRVLRLWLPLALSWLLMAVEQPALTATVARLAEQRVQLAAWGSVVFPISLVIEGPIIMLLAASTALCGDVVRYRRVRRFMLVSGAVLTLVHLAVAATPLYDLVTRGLLHTPPEVAEAARLPLLVMTPWTWAIAYRRFQQGVMIRFEQGRAVTEGTVVRLVSVLAGLELGFRMGWPGALVGSVAIATGVCVEALFVAWRVRPTLRRLAPAPPANAPQLDRRAFAAFYLPLALMPLITLCVQPIGAAAMGRMPNEIDSLAAWGPVYALVFLTRSVGMAYNEVVVTLLPTPGAAKALRRVRNELALVTTAVLALVGLTPLADLWFSQVQALAPDLAHFARVALIIALPMPLYQVMQSWYQGSLVARHHTRPVTEAVLIYLLVAGTGSALGAWLDLVPGLYWTVGSLVCAGVCQTAWLHVRSRSLGSEGLAAVG
jgi:progressive ankylosis protein